MFNIMNDILSITLALASGIPSGHSWADPIRAVNAVVYPESASAEDFNFAVLKKGYNIND